MKSHHLALASASLFVACAQPTPIQPRAVDARAALCAKADYPNAARRYDAEGTTQLEFIVDPQGTVSQVEVIRPSGNSAAHRTLDQAAMRSLLSCRFPAAPGYAPARARISYVWKLEPVQSYADAIRASIQRHIVISEPIAGNPVAEVEVTTAPDGRILSARLTKASSSQYWDSVVQVALQKAGRIPLDRHGAVPPTIILTFSPKP